jgi:RNA polymerase sigma-70 factor (ECF subfamily)
MESLLRRHEGRFFRFGMKMCGDPDDARDVLQETLLATARSLGGFRGESSIVSWLIIRPNPAQLPTAR